ncbi:MAG: hypothetical protein RLY97_597 [Pseudomonadota bacterium]
MTLPSRTARISAIAALSVVAFGLILAPQKPLETAAISAPSKVAKFPAPPAGGTMGFVVSAFDLPISFDKAACPHGTSPKMREAYLATQTEEERKRLKQSENEAEFNRKWQATAFGPNGTNVCSQPEAFQHPINLAVEGPLSYGLNLDGSMGAKAKDKDNCDHANFQSPTGEQGIDNQEYRAMGCTLEWRGVDGQSSDGQVGLRQFHSSGEWTQVILLKGVDSLIRDDAVEVIYANTADRPQLDSNGKFLRGMSFAISDTMPRHRNVLHGRIINGVLTTAPSDIKLTQTWGQGGARDIRGNRSAYHYVKGRLRLKFEADRTLRGFVGGYRPVFDVIISPALGGAGSAVVAGIDCASNLATLKKYADGIRDPKTGQCTGVSSAMKIVAVPAFVNDLPQYTKVAAK